MTEEVRFMHSREEALATASRAGSRESYSALVQMHLRRVFAICLGYLGQPADAEDAAQEVFLRGYQKIRTLDDTTRFKAWIDQIARNHCLDLLRRGERRSETPLPEGLSDHRSPSVADDIEMRAALARLPEKHRLPLILFYFQGKDTAALAQDLGLTQGGACTRLFRARVELRKLLEEGGTSHE
jgi:RNA polymerase sigma-70 factor (ECF subfamily)